VGLERRSREARSDENETNSGWMKERMKKPEEMKRITARNGN